MANPSSLNSIRNTKSGITSNSINEFINRTRDKIVLVEFDTLAQAFHTGYQIVKYRLSGL